MKGLYFHLLSVTLIVVSLLSVRPEAAPAAAGGGGGGALGEECNEDFQKVMMCLDFARGKVPKPTKECCSAVESIKGKDPKCLCFIIQQTKTGGQALKDLGVQEDKLLQLPSACQLHNASISDCPKLLGISPSSPDAAVFAGNSTSGSAPAGKSSPSMSEQKGGSAAKVDRHVAASAVVALAFVAVVSFSAFPALGLA